MLLVFLFIQLLNAQQQDLNYFLSLGLQNSPLLKDYQNRQRSALIDSMRLRAGLGYQISASSINSYAPVIQGWGYDQVKTDIAGVSALMGISKQITGKNNLLNKYQAIRLQNQSTYIEGSLSKKDLKKAIISQYILAYGNLKLHRVNEEVLGIMRQEEQIVKKLTEQGIFKQTEYLSLLVNRRQQEFLTAQSGYQYKTDLELLNYLCGIFDTAHVSLSEPELSVNSSAEPHHTIFFKQFETDSMKLANADRQINFDYQPKLSVYADGGYFSSMSYMPWKNFGMSAGLSLTVPIYDGHQRKMQHDQVAISEETRVNYKNFFTSQYRQQIAILSNQLTANEQLMHKSGEQLDIAQTLISANMKLLNTGDISVTDYLLSVNNYINAKNMLIQNSLEKFRIINEINYWSEK